MKPFLFLLTLGLCGIANANAQGFAKTEFKDSAGTKLRYAILKPVKIEPDTKYPLVVSLHGSGGRGNQNWQGNCAANRALGNPERRQKYPCYIIAPTVGRNERWGGAPLTALIELIKSSLKKHPIDPTRIYVTGQSMGGAGTYAAIMKEPNLFAAAAPVCGRGQTDLAKQIVHLPIWIFHGANDRVVPTRHSREMVEALKKAGGKPIYTEYPNVRHNSWTRAYEDEKFWIWLFSQKRKAKDAKVKALQEGLWRPLSATLGDKAMPAEILKIMTLRIEENHYTVKIGSQIDKGTWKLLPKTKPQAMDITGTVGPNKGKTIPSIV